MKDQEKISKKKSKAHKKRVRRRIIFAIEILVLLLAGGALFVVSKLQKLNTEKIDLGEISINAGIKENGNLKGYRNIALFGVDSRDGDLKNARSDMIMVASIDNDSKKVNLVSVYRDTYLDSKDGEFRKATETYALGSSTRAINMLNENLDLDITDYVTVDFSAVAKVVDLLGGIDLEITEEEMVHLNNYSIETSKATGGSYEPLSDYGDVHLNGIQAVSYCRIRYTDGGDFKRSERQREVIGLIAEKAKKTDLLTLNKMIDQVLPLVSTSFTGTQVISMASSMITYDMGETEGFPQENTPKNINKQDCIIPNTLESNVTQLHEFLFKDDAYVPSEKVKSISEEIIQKTGVK